MYSLAYFHRNQEGKLDEHLWNAYNAAKYYAKTFTWTNFSFANEKTQIWKDEVNFPGPG